MDVATNVLKLFVASQHETNVDEARYVYLQRLLRYMNMYMMGPNDPSCLRLVRYMIYGNMGDERHIVESARTGKTGTTECQNKTKFREMIQDGAIERQEHGH